MKAVKYASIALGFAVLLAGCKSFTPVTITLIPNSVELTEGQQVGFSAIGKDSDGILKEIDVEWSLAGDAIGSLTSSLGKRTTLISNSPGSGQIRAIFKTLANSAPVTVTELPGINRIEIIPDSWEMNIGEVKQFSVVGYVEGDSPIEVIGAWSVSGGVGTIAPSTGKLTQLFSTSAGNGTVTVSVGDYTQQARFSVTKQILTRIAVSPSPKSLYPGDEVEFTAVGYDQFNKSFPVEVFWSIEGNLGNISQYFGSSTKFKAINIGVGKITASTRDITTDATIDVMPVLQFIESSPSEAVIYVGQTIDISAIGGDEWSAHPYYDFHWSLANNNGNLSSTLGGTTKFTATKVGTEIVTCSLGGCSDITTLEILNQVKTIELNGTVESVDYHSLVPGVEVRFYTKSGDLLDVTYTDNLGRWSVTLDTTLPDDKYVIVQAGKEGYFIRTAKIFAEDRDDFLIRIVADDLNNFYLFAHEVWGPYLTIERFDHDNFAAFVIESDGFGLGTPEYFREVLLDTDRKVGEFIGTWDYDVYIDPDFEIAGNKIYIIYSPPPCMDDAAHWEEDGYFRCVHTGTAVFHYSSSIGYYGTLLHELGHITLGHPQIIDHSVMSYERDTQDYSEFDLKCASIANEDTYVIDVDFGGWGYTGAHEDGDTILGTIWGIDHIDSLQHDYYTNSIEFPIPVGTEIEI